MASPSTSPSLLSSFVSSAIASSLSSVSRRDRQRGGTTRVADLSDYHARDRDRRARERGDGVAAGTSAIVKLMRCSACAAPATASPTGCCRWRRSSGLRAARARRACWSAAARCCSSATPTDPLAGSSRAAGSSAARSRLSALRRELDEELGLVVGTAVAIATQYGPGRRRRHLTHVYRVDAHGPAGARRPGRDRRGPLVRSRVAADPARPEGRRGAANAAPAGLTSERAASARGVRPAPLASADRPHVGRRGS